MHTHLIAAIVTLMCLLSPPGRNTFIKEAQETREIALERYARIAEEIVAAATDPSEPSLGGRSATVAVLVSITYHESAGWRRDVDLGLARVRLAAMGWNDHGRAWCLGQVELGLKATPTGMVSAERTLEGWSGEDLLADRSKCIRATLHIASRSFQTCRALPLSDRLAMYAGGSCEGEDALEKSRRRMQLARKHAPTIAAALRLDIAAQAPPVVALVGWNVGDREQPKLQ